MLKYLALASAFACLISPAQARPHRHTAPIQCVETGGIMFPVCGMAPSGHNSFSVAQRGPGGGPASRREARRIARGEAVVRAVGFGVVRPSHRPARPATVFSAPRAPIDNGHAATIVSHPIGCPGRAFCGCGAAVRIFGRPVRELWLAANWFKFPRTAPAAGMVAVRSHHVFVLEQHLDGNTWLAYDANSGGHQTRLHARSIAGYTVVNPMGAS